MTIIQKMKKLIRFSRVNSPLMKLFNERWVKVNTTDETFKAATTRVQNISQELLDLVMAGLL